MCGEQYLVQTLRVRAMCCCIHCVSLYLTDRQTDGVNKIRGLPRTIYNLIYATVPILFRVVCLVELVLAAGYGSFAQLYHRRVDFTESLCVAQGKPRSEKGKQLMPSDSTLASSNSAIFSSASVFLLFFGLWGLGLSETADFLNITVQRFCLLLILSSVVAYLSKPGFNPNWSAHLHPKSL